MPDSDPDTRNKRTAVLVVHGIGSQRALETVRGVIRGLWLDRGNPYDDGRRIWSHPEPSGVDIDLTVITTNEVPGSRDKRCVDFHELYWAHLMSETRAVAVLLWLYELGRKGPDMRIGLNGLWWVAAIFLCLVNLSVTVLVLQAILLFSCASPQTMLVAPFLLLFSSVLFGLVIAMRWWAGRLLKALVLLAAVGGLLVIGAYFFVQERGNETVDCVTRLALPTLDALIATYVLMGRHGVRAFAVALVVSLLMTVVLVLVQIYWPAQSQWADGHSGYELAKLLLTSWPWTPDSRWNSVWPWVLDSPWSSVLSFAVIALYLAANSAFLTPYLGDAARYFRASPANVAVRRAIRKEAAKTLAKLNEDNAYDRIVVVAHSLGSVIAYDMLRAYFSRICNDLTAGGIGEAFKRIDEARWEPERLASPSERRQLREDSRQVITAIADHAAKQTDLGDHKCKRWLVTDFVTLGSALSHVYFLMCDGKSRSKLHADFARRVREREFPTCPPKRLDNDGLLTFKYPKTNASQIHHGALFGLTRWTNIYFPISQIFWGDAIGGPLGPIFGRHIADLPVSTRRAGGADFFTHTAYWDVEREPDEFQAPHITALRNAVDLAESGAAISLVDRAANDETGIIV